LSHLQENITAVELDNPEHAFLILVVTNISGAEEIAEWVRSQARVKTIRLDIEQDIIQIYQWFDQQIVDYLIRISRNASHRLPNLSNS